MERDVPARATRRRPVDPVLPNKRRNYVTSKMAMVKGKLRNLYSACGGMAACAVIFAAEPCSRGKTNVETVIFGSDNCLLTSMGFDVRETGAKPGYHQGAGVFQALAKERDLQSAKTLESLTPEDFRTLADLRKSLRVAILQRLNHDLNLQPEERPVTQAYADRRVQRPD